MNPSNIDSRAPFHELRIGGNQVLSPVEPFRLARENVTVLGKLNHKQTNSSTAIATQHITNLNPSIHT